MITQEQIKKLNPGDPLVVQGEFCQAYNNGNILVSLSVQKWETSMNEVRSFHPSCVSLPSEHGTEVPTPKHDPTRLFREGDKVQIKREINGRILHHSFISFEYDTIYTVKEDEVQKDYKSGHVTITDGKGRSCTLSFYELELVTPVEELEPYSIDPANTNVLFKHGKKIATFEDDDEAQELCDRLNAEYRKEQGND